MSVCVCVTVTPEQKQSLNIMTNIYTQILGERSTLNLALNLEIDSCEKAGSHPPSH